MSKQPEQLDSAGNLGYYFNAKDLLRRTNAMSIAAFRYRFAKFTSNGVNPRGYPTCPVVLDGNMVCGNNGISVVNLDNPDYRTWRCAACATPLGAMELSELYNKLSSVPAPGNWRIPRSAHDSIYDPHK